MTRAAETAYYVDVDFRIPEDFEFSTANLTRGSFYYYVEANN